MRVWRSIRNKLKAKLIEPQVMLSLETDHSILSIEPTYVLAVWLLKGRML